MRSGSTPGASRRVASLLLLAGLALGGCAGMPTVGPVQQVRDDDDLAGSTVRYAPAPPQPGASPQQVVTGYLDAMLAYPVSTGVAEKYLTASAAERWNPAAGTHVYRAATTSAPRPARQDDSEGAAEQGTVEVRLTTEPVLDLDVRGRVERTRSQDERTVRLQRVDGEWRIAEAVEGTLVSEEFYASYYRPFDLYFFDAPGERLVPSVVHLPVGEQLATSLVTTLARGPADDTAQLRTYVPGLQDVRPSVPVDADGVADVDLGPDAAALPVADQGRLAAQLVRTLAQVTDLTGVRLSAGSGMLTPRDQTVQAVDSWGRYVPRAVEPGPFGIVGGRAMGLVGDRLEPAPDAWAVDPDDTSELDVGSARVATVDAARDTVRVRTRSGSEPIDVAAVDVVAARWAPTDTLVVVDAPDGARVRAVGPDTTRVLPAPGLTGRDVTSFAISPDGARYAATIGGSSPDVVVGAVRRTDDDEVTGLGEPVSTDWGVERPASVTWPDGATVAVIADSDLGRQVYTGRIDATTLAGGGLGGTAVLPDVGARVLVARGDEQWVVDARDRLWHKGSSSTWTLLDVGDVGALSPSS